MELLADVSLLPGEERIIGKCECSFIQCQKSFNYVLQSNKTVIYILRLIFVDVQFVDMNRVPLLNGD